MITMRFLVFLTGKHTNVNIYSHEENKTLRLIHCYVSIKSFQIYSFLNFNSSSVTEKKIQFLSRPMGDV